MASTKAQTDEVPDLRGLGRRARLNVAIEYRTSAAGSGKYGEALTMEPVGPPGDVSELLPHDQLSTFSGPLKSGEHGPHHRA